MPYDLKSIEDRAAPPAEPAASPPGTGPPPPLEAAWLKIVEHPTLREICSSGDGTGIFPVHRNGNKNGRKRVNGNGKTKKNGNGRLHLPGRSGNSE